MKCVFEDATPLDDGVWVAKSNPEDIQEVSTGQIQRGRTSLIVVRNAVYDSDSSTLAVSIGEIDPLFVGQSNKVIILDQSDKEGFSLRDVEEEHNFKSQDHSAARGRHSAFLAAAKREGLPDNLLESMRSLLAKLSDKYAFSLHEGKARKWTADPNFVAFTIQNRKRQFLVSVKGDRSRMQYTEIKPVAGRGPTYCEFHFFDEIQLPEVLHAIEQSAKH